MLSSRRGQDFSASDYIDVLDRRIIDLTLPLEDSVSEANAISVELLSHTDAPELFGLSPDDFPDGYAISNETVTLTTHSGTHVDAPLHYGPKCLNDGSDAISIDHIRLSDCVGRAVCLDMRNSRFDIGITVEDLSAEFERQNVNASDVDIVLLWTDADKLWGTQRYLTDYAGLTMEGCSYLLELGIKVIGIDAWGLDQPMHIMLSRYQESGDPNTLWPSHILGRRCPYLQIEKMCNLSLLPTDGSEFVVFCLPIPVKGVGAGWTRVFALT